MAYAIKVPGVSFDTSLPNITDFGALPAADPETLAKFNDPAAPLKNSSSSGGGLVYTGTATGGDAPTVSNGKLIVPGESGDTFSQVFSTPAVLTDTPVTFMCLVKPTAEITQYLFWLGVGGPSLVLSGGTTLTLRSTTEKYFGNLDIGVWQFIALIVREDGSFVVQRNDAVYHSTYTEQGWTYPEARTVNYTLGNPTMSPGLACEIALIGVYDGSITEAERLNAYRGIKAFAKRKGITLGAA